MNREQLRDRIGDLFSRPSTVREEALPVVEQLLLALEAGELRAARPTSEGWEVEEWVKQGILLGFRVGVNVPVTVGEVFHFRDRDTFPTRNPAEGGRNVRVVPGGSTVRRGAFLGEGVVVMPPAYINVGAYVGADSMVDSHALVGSCAQIGSRVHLSAAAQVGGVLEPIGALPVIVEDDVFVGGGCGIYEGTHVRQGAVLAPGVILTRAVGLYDLVQERVLRASGEGPLTVPERAVVVSGTRPARGAFAADHGLSLQAPVIVKYRDEETSSSVALEDALR